MRTRGARESSTSPNPSGDFQLRPKARIAEVSPFLFLSRPLSYDLRERITSWLVITHITETHPRVEA
jgi:hypothetical protein